MKTLKHLNSSSWIFCFRRLCMRNHLRTGFIIFIIMVTNSDFLFSQITMETYNKLDKNYSESGCTDKSLICETSSSPKLDLLYNLKFTPENQAEINRLDDKKWSRKKSLLFGSGCVLCVYAFGADAAAWTVTNGSGTNLLISSLITGGVGVVLLIKSFNIE